MLLAPFTDHAPFTDDAQRDNCLAQCHTGCKEWNGRHDGYKI